MIPLSAFIIALNEADRIGYTIASLKSLANDIVVIDSGSTDGTQETATQAGARVIFNPWPGYGQQKRFAETQCQHDWVLNLDADEVLSDQLIKEIRNIFQQPPPHDAYHLTIAEILPVEQKAPRFGHRVSPVRLYRRSRGSYADSTVHDRVELHSDAKTASLHGLVWHRSSRSLTHSVEKLNRYSSMQADHAIQKGTLPDFILLRLVTEFPLAFLKAYLFRKQCLKGTAGFINAVTYGFSRFIRIAKMIELQRKKQ